MIHDYSFVFPVKEISTVLIHTKDMEQEIKLIEVFGETCLRTRPGKCSKPNSDTNTGKLNLTLRNFTQYRKIEKGLHTVWTFPSGLFIKPLPDQIRNSLRNTTHCNEIHYNQSFKVGSNTRQTLF